MSMLFHWLVTGRVLDVNPAHAVRGPKYSVKKGKTPVLTPEEAGDLLDSIANREKHAGRGRRGRCHLNPPARKPLLHFGGSTSSIPSWGLPIPDLVIRSTYSRAVVSTLPLVSLRSAANSAGVRLGWRSFVK